MTGIKVVTEITTCASGCETCRYSPSSGGNIAGLRRGNNRSDPDSGGISIILLRLWDNGWSRISLAEFGGIAFGQPLDQFVVEVVVFRSNLRVNALVIHFSAAIDVIAQTVVEIAMRASFNHFLLIVMFDLGDQKASEATRLVMECPFGFIGDFDRQGVIIVAIALDWRRASPVGRACTGFGISLSTRRRWRMIRSLEMLRTLRK